MKLALFIILAAELSLVLLATRIENPDVQAYWLAIRGGL